DRSRTAVYGLKRTSVFLAAVAEQQDRDTHGAPALHASLARQSVRPWPGRPWTGTSTSMGNLRIRPLPMEPMLPLWTNPLRFSCALMSLVSALCVSGC